MKTLQTEVAAKYQLIGIRPGKYNFKGFGEIDLCSLDLVKANNLVSKGFPFLKPRIAGTMDPKGTTGDQKVRPIRNVTQKISVKAPEADIDPTSTGDPRKNLQYVNKLLTMDWPQLTSDEQNLFFNDLAYFLMKRMALLEVSKIDREMRALHEKAKVKQRNAADKEELQDIMDRLASLDDRRTEKFRTIDDWTPPAEKEEEKKDAGKADASADPEVIARKAAEEALEKDKLIKAHGNYIYRAELKLPNMPVKTQRQRELKAAKEAEVQRRKEELQLMGVPYQRKSRR